MFKKTPPVSRFITEDFKNRYVLHSILEAYNKVSGKKCGQPKKLVKEDASGYDVSQVKALVEKLADSDDKYVQQDLMNLYNDMLYAVYQDNEKISYNGSMGDIYNSVFDGDEENGYAFAPDKKAYSEDDMFCAFDEFGNFSDSKPNGKTYIVSFNKMNDKKSPFDADELAKYLVRMATPGKKYSQGEDYNERARDFLQKHMGTENHESVGEATGVANGRPIYIETEGSHRPDYKIKGNNMLFLGRRNDDADCYFLWEFTNIDNPNRNRLYILVKATGEDDGSGGFPRAEYSGVEIANEFNSNDKFREKCRGYIKSGSDILSLEPEINNNERPTWTKKYYELGDIFENPMYSKIDDEGVYSSSKGTHAGTITNPLKGAVLASGILSGNIFLH
jgi:hypothetical protein